MKVVDVTSHHPAAQPHAPLDREWSEDLEIDPFKGVLFLWRARYAILAAVVIFVVAAFVATQFMAPQYTAIATVFVSTPKAINTLAPEPMSVQALEQLADSDLIRARIDAELSKRGLAGPAARVRNFRTILYASSDAAKPYLPVLGLAATATTGDLARQAADIWAAVLVEAQSKISEADRSAAVDFILHEYPLASTRLHQEEQRKEAIKQKQDRAMDTAKSRAAKSLREAQVWSREQLVVQLEEERHRVQVDLNEAKGEVASIEEELKKVPQLVTVTRGIGDDALLENAARNDGRPTPEILDARLRSQEINPVYTDLTRQLAQARVKRAALEAREPALAAQIEQTRREASALSSALTTGAREVADLEAHQATELAATDREVENARSSFKKLEERIGDAQIVKAIGDSSLRVGSPAELPTAPSGPERVRFVLLAGAAGLVLALCGTWIYERSRRAAAL